MRVKVYFKGVVINVKSVEGKEGKVYHRISLDCDGEAGTFACSEDVYKAFGEGFFQKYEECEFSASYNSQYGSLQILSVVPVE